MRETRKLKQNAMADSIGFNRTTWNNYETGKSQPNLSDFMKLLEIFGVSASDLLEKDLSKGEFSKIIKPSKISKKSEHSGEFQGEFKVKKHPINKLSTLTSEEELGHKIVHRMPLVITVDNSGEENVIMVPVRARAGYLNGYSDPEFISKLPSYTLPGLNNGTYRLFEVEGLSMYPTLHGGDLIIGSFVEQVRDVRDDRIHVVVTKNDGIVVKRVLNRIQKDTKLILKSDNYKDRDLYPPIVCNPSDIIEVWYAIGYISRQMKPPAETYNRVIDLEGRLTLLEDVVRKGKK